MRDMLWSASVTSQIPEIAEKENYVRHVAREAVIWTSRDRGRPKSVESPMLSGAQTEPSSFFTLIRGSCRATWRREPVPTKGSHWLETHGSWLATMASDHDKKNGH